MKKVLSNSMEMKIYEFLGVRLFQKLTFILERIIHKRDGGKNQNYHFSKRSGATKAELFIKYLFFNGTIHVKNIIFGVIYFTIKLIFWEFKIYDILFVLLGIKDVYCVMLQRYNYLRIKSYIDCQNKIRERRIAKKSRLILNDYNKNGLLYSKDNLELVRKMRLAIQNNEELKLTLEDSNVLEQLYSLLNGGQRDEML